MSESSKFQARSYARNGSYILADEHLVVAQIRDGSPYASELGKLYERMAYLLNIFKDVEDAEIQTLHDLPREDQKLALAVLREPGNVAPLSALIDNVQDRINYPGETHASNEQLRDMLREIAETLWLRRSAIDMQARRNILKLLNIHCTTCKGLCNIFQKEYPEEAGQWYTCPVCSGTGKRN